MSEVLPETIPVRPDERIDAGRLMAWLEGRLPGAAQAATKLRAPFEAIIRLPQYPVADAYEFYLRLFAPVAERLAKAAATLAHKASTGVPGRSAL